jgi:hypothetical protein
MRFHDLRGTTATLLARAGVGLVVAQRILRHSDPRLTANIYSRVDLADLQAGDRPDGHPRRRSGAVVSRRCPCWRTLADFGNPCTAGEAGAAAFGARAVHRWRVARV